MQCNCGPDLDGRASAYSAPHIFYLVLSGSLRWGGGARNERRRVSEGKGRLTHTQLEQGRWLATIRPALSSFKFRKMRTFELMGSLREVVVTQNRTRSQAIARIADRTASQQLLESRDVVVHVTVWLGHFLLVVLWNQTKLNQFSRYSTSNVTQRLTYELDTTS